MKSTQKRLLLLKAKFLIQAEGIKEYEAQWLKNQKKVFRDAFGRFTAKAASFEEVVEDRIELSLQKGMDAFSGNGMLAAKSAWLNSWIGNLPENDFTNALKSKFKQPEPPPPQSGDVAKQGLKQLRSALTKAPKARSKEDAANVVHDAFTGAAKLFGATMMRLAEKQKDKEEWEAAYKKHAKKVQEDPNADLIEKAIVTLNSALIDTNNIAGEVNKFAAQWILPMSIPLAQGATLATAVADFTIGTAAGIFIDKELEKHGVTNPFIRFAASVGASIGGGMAAVGAVNKISSKVLSGIEKESTLNALRGIIPGASEKAAVANMATQTQKAIDKAFANNAVDILRGELRHRTFDVPGSVIAKRRNEIERQLHKLEEPIANAKTVEDFDAAVKLFNLKAKSLVEDSKVTNTSVLHKELEKESKSVLSNIRNNNPQRSQTNNYLEFAKDTLRKFANKTKTDSDVLYEKGKALYFDPDTLQGRTTLQTAIDEEVSSNVKLEAERAYINLKKTQDKFAKQRQHLVQKAEENAINLTRVREELIDIYSSYGKKLENAKKTMPYEINQIIFSSTIEDAEKLHQKLSSDIADLKPEFINSKLAELTKYGGDASAPNIRAFIHNTVTDDANIWQVSMDDALEKTRKNLIRLEQKGIKPIGSKPDFFGQTLAPSVSDPLEGFALRPGDASVNVKALFSDNAGYVTREEADAISDYTNHGYTPVNNALRHGNPSDEIIEQINRINSGLARLPRYKGRANEPLTRLVTLDEDIIINKLNPGDIYSDPAYASVSMSYKGTGAFRDNSTRFNLKMIVKPTEESMARDIHSLNKAFELEALYPPGSRFRILKKYQQQYETKSLQTGEAETFERWVVELEEVSPTTPTFNATATATANNSKQLLKNVDDLQAKATEAISKDTENVASVLNRWTNTAMNMPAEQKPMMKQIAQKEFDAAMKRVDVQVKQLESEAAKIIDTNNKYAITAQRQVDKQLMDTKADLEDMKLEFDSIFAANADELDPPLGTLTSKGRVELTMDEYDALEAYTQNPSDINKVLRQQQLSDPDTAEAIAQMQSALAKLPNFEPKEPITRFLSTEAGTAFDDAIAKLKPGDTIKEAGFASATPSKVGTGAFHESDPALNVKMVINNKGQSKAKELGTLNRGEDELIYPPGQKFKVTGRKTEKYTDYSGVERERTIIEVEES